MHLENNVNFFNVILIYIILDKLIKTLKPK